jgi:signal transduction histidine kinase
MGKSELIIFIILVNIILLIFIIGTVVFVLEYRKRKLFHEAEKTDILESHRLQLLNAQLEIKSQTMEFIGQEIHDSVTQKLTLASIYSQQIEFGNEHLETKNKLVSINKQINDAIIELRELSHNLTNPTYQNADLKTLIGMECERVNAIGVYTIGSDMGILPPLNTTSKNALLRVVQEFIQNSIKHAECKNIAISISSSDEQLILSLKDDGKGFDVKNTDEQGMGLNTIRNRIQKLDGTCQFTSSQHQGVKLNAYIPINSIKV